jgi:hypothetical protein
MKSPHSRTAQCIHPVIIFAMGLTGMIVLAPPAFSTTQPMAPTTAPVHRAGDRAIADRPSITPPAPPSLGRPRGTRTAAGGHRGLCAKVDIPLTALVPLTEAETLAQRPTFWFYSPYNGLSLPATFTLQNQQGNAIATPISVQIPPTAGLVRVQLPPTVELEINQPYTWFLEVDCNNGLSTQPPISIEGTVRRVVLNASAAKQLTATAKDPRQQLAFYTANNLWLDALTTLLDLRRVAPHDPQLKAEWQTLLRSLTLDEFAETPVVQSSPR